MRLLLISFLLTGIVGLFYFFQNPRIDLEIPVGFPPLNSAVHTNWPTKQGVRLGEKLFHDVRLSVNQQVSCASCHQAARAFSDTLALSRGVEGREGHRNAPSLQNLAFQQHYNWDGNILQLEKHALIPIITYEEMDFSILQFIKRIQDDVPYKVLFLQAFGVINPSSELIFKSLAQYQYTLISANSRYDRLYSTENSDQNSDQNPIEKWTEEEAQGYVLFKQKCQSCHAGPLFTDQSFRNKGFPQNENFNDPGRARVTLNDSDWGAIKVPTLRNLAKTAPYGSQGQFQTLEEVLDYMSSGVQDSETLDPIFKQNNLKIPLTSHEKTQILAFLASLNNY